MSILTKEQAIQRAKSEDIWKVHVFESERGLGCDSWDSFFDSRQEAFEYYERINKDLPTDHVPDCYAVASTPEKVSLTIK
jgi:hypothetical protein